ncbi:MAG: helix-turn-helix domain-containing protein [Alphaproteobacteria bacterium]|nr:MAG: helix-turn-helix domain-containing protein [Alphaproteobacteria bacterium]
MSRRSLQRKLRQEGADFRSILSAVRSELAAEYAKNRELSATVIAYELGFSGPAQFAVAFRGWYGMSFTDYRNRLSPRSQR